jgi:deferrochelatase/peroxidase EfeB
VNEIDRRGFLRAAAVGGVVAGASAITARTEGPVRPGHSDASATPFHGQHQSGILTPRRAATALIAFDFTTRNRAELIGVMKTLTGRLGFLAAGGVPHNVGISSPPADSGILGPAVVPDGLTATLALGSSVFDDRFGLAERKPMRLRPMDTFPNDNLDPAQCHGDLLVQLSADHPDTVVHALRDLSRSTGGAIQARWRIDGTLSPPRPSGLRATTSDSRTEPRTRM